MSDAVPQLDLVGRRFRPLRYHARTRGRTAVVLRVKSSPASGCGVLLTYRYEDAPPRAERSCSQRFFLANFAPIVTAAEVPS